MHTITAIFNTAILLGAIQGLIFAGLLFFTARNPFASRLLSALLFLMALASCKLYGSIAGWFDAPFMRWVDAFVPMIVIMPIGPLVYFYMRSMLEPDFRLSRKDRIHFYPVLIDLGPQLTALIFVLGMMMGIFVNDSQPWGRFIDQYNVYADIPRWGALSFYVWMAGRLVRQYPASPYYGWLRQVVRFFMVFQGIWLVYLIPYVIPRYTDIVLDLVDWYPIYIPMAVLIYWMGIRGFLVAQKEFPVRKEKAAFAPGGAERLTRAMTEDRLYLDPALNLALLAAHTGISQKTISAILNQQLQKSFSEFVNEYRVNAMKERLLLGDIRTQTIAGIAFDCGFNSLPTFQRAFKAITGQTPREFLSKNAIS